MKTFEVLQKMSDDNMNIKLAPLGNIIEINITKRGGEVTIGIDSNTATELLNDLDGTKFVGGLLLADKTQFDKLQQEE